MFSNISPAREEGTPREVIIQFDYDIDGIIHISAIDRLASRKEEGLTITESQIKLSSEQKAQARDAIVQLENKGKMEEGLIQTLLDKTTAFHKKLQEEKRPDNIIKEVGELLAKLEKAKQEGKLDNQVAERISELMYDYDYE
jgi:hypothetical protein